MKIFLNCRFSALGKIDGMDLWKALSEDLTSERTDVLHNIDDIYGNAALTVGEWKIVKGLELFQINTVTKTVFFRHNLQWDLGFLVWAFGPRRDLQHKFHKNISSRSSFGLDGQAGHFNTNARIAR